MSDNETVTYHSLSRNERDHLLAVYQLRDETASGQDIQHYIEALRGDRPCNSSTYGTLGALQDMDLLRKETVNGKTNAWQPTEYGWALLEEAAGVFPDA